MSTNIHIVAEREVQVIKTGKISKQTFHFSEWQTPTKITYQIAAAADKVQAYKDWVLSISEDTEEPIYAEDDVFNEEEPIGTRTYNSGKEHCAELDQWVKEVTEEGYDIEFEVW
jgi:hypothetical protein